MQALFRVFSPVCEKICSFSVGKGTVLAAGRTDGTENHIFYIII